MTFLAPWLLCGLGGIAAPVLIHLWRRRRRVQLRFGTLRFLKMAAARTSRSSRVENLLLLLLRCAIFALVALAIAQPVTKPGLGALPGNDAPGTVVLVIDNSLSMAYRAGGRTRLDEAKAEALAVIDHLKPGDRVAVFAANEHADPLLPEPTVDHAVARNVINGTPQTELGGEFGPALREAANVVSHAARGVRQVFLFTDNQRTGWQFSPASVFDETWQKSGATLVVVRPDGLESPNAAISQVKMQTPYLTAGQSAHGVATVRNFSAAPFHDIMEVRIENGRVAQRPVEIVPGGSADVTFDFTAPSLPGHFARGLARLSGDNLAADDQFLFAVPVYQPPRVLIVEGQQIGPAPVHSAFYLRKALAAGGNTDMQIIPAAGLDDAAVENFSAIMLVDAGSVSDWAMVKLDRFLDSGGTVAIFPGYLPTNLWQADFSPVKDGTPREVPAGRLATKIADPADPLFVNTWDAETPFPALPLRRMLDAKLAPDAKVLITAGAGLPFLVARSHGPGRVLLINASADRAWGDLPLSPAFLPLVQQIARVSGALGGGNAQLTVGNAIPAAPNLPRDEPLRLTLPGGGIRSIPGGSSTLLDNATQAGFYEARSARAAALFAVNTDPRESDLKQISPSELDAIAPHDLVTGLENLKLWLAQARGLVPLWPPLLLLALALYAVEAVLSNAMARKRSQGEDAHIATGRLNKHRTGTPFRPAETGAAS